MAPRRGGLGSAGCPERVSRSDVRAGHFLKAIEVGLAVRTAGEDAPPDSRRDGGATKISDNVPNNPSLTSSAIETN